MAVGYQAYVAQPPVRRALESGDNDNGAFGSPSPTALQLAVDRPGYRDDQGVATMARPVVAVAANGNDTDGADLRREEGDVQTGRRPAGDAEKESRRQQHLAATMGYRPPTLN